MNLTIEQQRKLTEFLGGNYPLANLDFTDWRVVGRLIEKCSKTVDNPIFLWMRKQQYAARLQVKNNSNRKRLGFTTYASSYQEAICLAVLAWLEGEK